MRGTMCSGLRHTVIALVLAITSAAQANVAEAESARRAFADGSTSFRLGHFHEAIDLWEQGYKLSRDPVFLYNIGQAYRLAQDPDRALFFYRSFLDSMPRAPNRPDVERRIAQ